MGEMKQHAPAGRKQASGTVAADPAMVPHDGGLSQQEQARRILQFLKTSNARLSSCHGNKVELTRQMKVLQRVVGNRRATAAMNDYLHRQRDMAAAAALQKQAIEEEELQLRAAPKVLQKQYDLDDEELLQGKAEKVQRQELEDEGLPQSRFVRSEAPRQRQNVSDRGENRTGMPDQLKAGLEQLSDLDLSDVRVHYNSPKPADVNALAYVQGRDIHLGPGQEQHLAHEGWHVVQQIQGRVQPTMQAHGLAINDDEGLEREADVMGFRASHRKGSDENAPEDPVQRKIFLAKPGVAKDDNPKKHSFKDIMSRLEQEGFKISPQQSAVIRMWASDGEERKYKTFLALKSLVNDVKAELDQLPPQKRSWQKGLDPVAFAWRKLVGEEDDGIGLRKTKILGAPKVFIHRNVDARIRGEWLNKSSDFPVKVFAELGRRKQLIAVHAFNVLGAGRLKELRSYLEMVGVDNNKIKEMGEPTDVEDFLRKTLELDKWPKKIHLSVMPISIVFQINDPERNIKVTEKGFPYSYASFQVQASDGTKQNHIVCDIKWANGVIVEHLLIALNKAGISLDAVNLHGICGSLTPALPRGRLVAPRGTVTSLDQGNDPINIPGNDLRIDHATYVMDHGSVSSIMQEDDETLWRLLEEEEIHTLEMETYHLVRGLEETGHTGTVRIVFTVSDVMTSPHENLGNPEPHTQSSLIARRQRNELIIEAFGLGKSREYRR